MPFSVNRGWNFSKSQRQIRLQWTNPRTCLESTSNVFGKCSVFFNPAKWFKDSLHFQWTRFGSGCSWLAANKLLSLSSNNIPLLLLLLVALLLLQLLALCSSMISRSSSSSSRSSDSSSKSSFWGDDGRNRSLHPDDSLEADDGGRFKHDDGESLSWKKLFCSNKFSLEGA